MGKITYPFVPKSNRYLRPGQYWAVPLSNGQFAAGRVIDVSTESRVEFLIGLMDWVGSHPPTSDDLAGRKTLTQGGAGYKTILDIGGEILGHRPLELDGIEPDLMLNPAGWPVHGCIRASDRSVQRHGKNGRPCRPGRAGGEPSA